MSKGKKAFFGAMVSVSLFLTAVVLATLASRLWGTGKGWSALSIVAWAFAIETSVTAVIAVRAAAAWVKEEITDAA